jgi:chitin disaccharide deacetylase
LDPHQPMQPRSAPLLLIFTADDLGRDEAINRAVGRAYREGVLTAASLMVAGAALDGALAVARANPELGIGLHAVTVDGPSVLGHAALPHITEASGRFPTDPFRLGVRYLFSRVAREELAAELEAQFQRFAETGLSMSHVDGHCHLHMHPAVLPLVLRLADRWGAPGFRLPKDDLRTSLSFDRSRMATQLLWSAYFGGLRRWGERVLSQSSLARTDRVYGLYRSGRMTEPYVLHILETIPHGVRSVELYLHPSERYLGEPLGPNPGDLETLQSPRVRSAIQALPAERITYRELAKRRGMAP